MATSAEQINSLIAANTALKTFFEGERAALETARANLDGLLRARMTFSGTVDAANAGPNPQDGGIFPSIPALIAASPNGAHVTVQLLAGQTYELTESVVTGNRFVVFKQTGSAANPVIRPQSFFMPQNVNYFQHFFIEGGEIVFINVDLDLTAPRADPAFPTDVGRSAMITFRDGHSARVGMAGGKVTGVDGRGLVSIARGTAALVSLFSVELDGAYAVTGATFGAAVISKHSVTLTNGGALADGGTLGTNLIHN